MNGPWGDSWRAALTRLDRLDSRRVGLAALILSMATGVAFLLWLERGALFASDEWSWIYISGTGSLLDTLHPLNQHLMAVPLLIFKGLIAIWGLSFLPFKLAEMIGVVACSALVYVFARSRIGPILALAPAMMPIFFGTATAILLQPLIGVQLLYAVAFGLGALLAVERSTRGGDALACLLLCLSITSFSTGLAFLVGVAVAVLLAEERWRRAYVFVVPAALYFGLRVWATQFGTSGGPELANVPILPFYFVDSFAATVASLFGRAAIVGPGPGTALFLQGISLENAAVTVVYATLALAVVAYAFRSLRRRGEIPPTFWSTLSVLVALWVLQGLVLNEGRTPGETRYLYASALILLLIAVEAGRGVRLGKLSVAIVLAVAVAGIAGNLPRFKEGREGIVLHSTRARAYTEVMELAGANANPAFNPAVEAPEVAPAGVLNFSVDNYLELSDRHGSLAYTVPELIGQGEEVRYGSDVIAVRILEPAPRRATRLPRGGCPKFDTGPGGGFVELPPGGAALRADRDTRVSLRRFADRLVVPIGKLEAAQPAYLRIPSDDAGVPWKLELEGPLTITVCDVADAASGTAGSRR